MTLAQTPQGPKNKPPASNRAELSRAKYAIVKDVAVAVAAHELPPIDEGAKNIFSSQVGTLLRGGYPVELVRRVAVALALQWSEARGYNAMLHLAARVRAIDGDAARAQHESQTAAERERLDPRVAARLSPAMSARRPHPNGHAFVVGSEPNTCALDGCGGPLGVHVRLVELDSDGSAVVVATGIVR